MDGCAVKTGLNDFCFLWKTEGKIARVPFEIAFSALATRSYTHIKYEKRSFDRIIVTLDKESSLHLIDGQEKRVQNSGDEPIV